MLPLQPADLSLKGLHRSARLLGRNLPLRTFTGQTFHVVLKRNHGPAVSVNETLPISTTFRSQQTVGADTFPKLREQRLPPHRCLIPLMLQANDHIGGISEPVNQSGRFQ